MLCDDNVSTASVIWRRIIYQSDRISEFGRIWEQRVEAYFKVGIISRHSSGKTGEKHGECEWKQSVSRSELVPSISLTQICIRPEEGSPFLHIYLSPDA
jgi:hypothetical protein